jgi:hypothetical protein
MISTDEGIQILVSDEQKANAKRPKVETLEPISNVTTERVLH